MIATHPKTFDFSNEFLDRQVLYFGELSVSSTSKIDDNRLLSILNKNAAKLESNKKTVIYCSLGTVTINFLSVCHSFFRKISLVAALNPSVEFILAVGKRYDINQLGKTPSNLSVFPFVPQAELLKHVDLMINHGGINTIKECIREGVPMIVYPLSLEWDQPGCAARVVYHKLGLMGNIRKEGVKTINKKIQDLIKNLERYKASVRHMRDRIEEVNMLEQEKILSLIEDNMSNKISTTNFLHYDPFQRTTK